MKKLLIIICTTLGTFFTAHSQFSINFIAGVSPGANPKTNGIIVNRQNPHEEFQFNMIHVNPQFSGGLVAHLQMRESFFLESGMTYSQKTSSYKMDYRMPREEGTTEQTMKESEHLLLLPFNIGVSLGSFDVTSGLTVRKSFSKTNELTQLKGFSQEKNSIKLGWQAGIRYAFHRVLLGVEYQANLNPICQDRYVNGQSLQLMNVPGNFVFSVQSGFSRK
ncbi:MAG: hypothetical protein ABIQ02_12370 [Saprospiraceae bacterium]